MQYYISSIESLHTCIDLYEIDYSNTIIFIDECDGFFKHLLTSPTLD